MQVTAGLHDAAMKPATYARLSRWQCIIFGENRWDPLGQSERWDRWRRAWALEHCQQRCVSERHSLFNWGHGLLCIFKLPRFRKKILATCCVGRLRKSSGFRRTSAMSFLSALRTMRRSCLRCFQFIPTSVRRLSSGISCRMSCSGTDAVSKSRWRLMKTNR